MATRYLAIIISIISHIETPIELTTEIIYPSPIWEKQHLMTYLANEAQ